MKATDLNLKKHGLMRGVKLVSIIEPRKHYDFLMSLGNVFPSTKQQAETFISKGYCLDILNYDDVDYIEKFMTKHGYCGDYQYTNSHKNVRLVNVNELEICIKKEFGLIK